MRIQDDINLFCPSSMALCYRWASNVLIVVDFGVATTKNIGCPSIISPSKMDKQKILPFIR